MARIPLSANRHQRIVTATKLGLAGSDVAAYAHIPVEVLDRWLRDGAVATRGKQRDLYLAVQQARADFRLGVQAGLLKAAKAGNTKAAALLLELGRDANPSSSPDEALADAVDSVDFGILEGLSDAQMTAARMMVSGKRMTTKQIASKIGVPPSTLSHWKGDPRFADAVRGLREQLHRVTVHSIVRGATAGVLAQEESLHRLRVQLARADDVDEMVKLTRAINLIATSLQDRGGYPRTERKEIETTDASSAPRPHREESTDELRARIRLLKSSG